MLGWQNWSVIILLIIQIPALFLDYLNVQGFWCRYLNCTNSYCIYAAWYCKVHTGIYYCNLLSQSLIHWFVAHTRNLSFTVFKRNSIFCRLLLFPLMSANKPYNFPQTHLLNPVSDTRVELIRKLCMHCFSRLVLWSRIREFYNS